MAEDVTVVCQLFHPELISTGQTLTELVEELARLGIRLSVIAGQPTVLAGTPKVPSLIEHHGIPIHRTWSTRLPKTSAAGKLLNLTTFFLSASWRILRKHRHSQLLLLTNPPYLPLLGWLCSLLRRQRFGVILFDIMPEQAESLGFLRPGGLLAKGWRRFNRLWYPRADYAVVLSEDMLEGALDNALLRGTSAEPGARARTHIIHVWSDDRVIQPIPKSDSTEAARLGVRDRFVVQYSGNHARFHDIETLLEIASRVAPDDGITLQFIGEGQKKRLVDERLRATPRPHWYSSSYVEKAMLPDSLAMADLGVVAQLPGQERVCYPSKLLGIMAAGRAVLAICPPGCAMARMIREHRIGYVVANGDADAGVDALRHARDHREEVDAMGARAAHLLRERFTLRQAAEAYAALIRQSRDAGGTRP